jgi:hypothetical protein
MRFQKVEPASVKESNQTAILSVIQICNIRSNELEVTKVSRSQCQTAGKFLYLFPNYLMLYKKKIKIKVRPEIHLLPRCQLVRVTPPLMLQPHEI